MSRTTQTLGLVLVYTVIIVGTVIWSGRIVEKTLYDKYIIYLEGIILPVTDLEATSEFYRDVLNFTELEKSPAVAFGERAFIIANQKKLFLRQIAEEKRLTPVIVVRVRNGFKKLHQSLLRRFGGKAQMMLNDDDFSKMDTGRVSQIITWKNPGDQFFLSDQNHNIIIFYQQRRHFFRGR